MKQPATITRPGIPGQSEPHALLSDGRTMPMGWNMGKTFPVGTTGDAEYIASGYASLWRFTPDADKAPDRCELDARTEPEPAALDLDNGSTRMAREVRAAFGADNG